MTSGPGAARDEFAPDGGSGAWICRPCSQPEPAAGAAAAAPGAAPGLAAPLGILDCSLCPRRGGAFLATGDAAGRWAHATCARLTPGVVVSAGAPPPVRARKPAAKPRGANQTTPLGTGAGSSTLCPPR